MEGGVTIEGLRERVSVDGGFAIVSAKGGLTRVSHRRRRDTCLQERRKERRRREHRQRWHLRRGC
ncbi:uncharacterized protein DS421_20g695930 [Arachis hypogaea]|nr:uncharacterized protein DS421_20g695930 [Arachis hypogaea]